ncbi:transcriptional regulator, TetR family [Streptoalloteichus tenebrarius]|uniref:Transcriptional regulator, TetR family n=1 Tax=Streptoalloteichus tenebrarius (strain ATCC 17920 / DSM 40477 / JCM 4838 / CBS 697.72 / NBRC 16177 / NCIMB 11028 / NRRL B-12390 / A12253. 1 / ISP 5477) TaxID=1933 RepID=A0ABT1HYH0_STRSD|nr:TetR family transcriptional regulator [Streptoalloteichus tenebrarius]MCP2260576.1 transcriptional regulator, TetR family [Streptoalloteichus tenebrarius]
MSTAAAPLRRRPVQQRSAQRVERMLDACAELIDELGHDGVTTTLIAERAGVAVGSLYQFFPDKRAVVQALTLRNLDRFLATVLARFEEGGFEHWWDAVDSVIDIYIGMHREVPGFGRLHFGDVVDPRLLDERKDNNAVIADRISALLVQHFGLAPGELELPVAVAVEAADAVLNLAFRRDPQGAPEIVTEAKAMIRDYLSARIGEPA